MSRKRTADAYIRVSRRAGREGESFISPEVQRKKIAAWAKLTEVEIVHWWEEIDQSGAKLERPMFQQALARCEAGETGGIVVARLDRDGEHWVVTDANVVNERDVDSLPGRRSTPLRPTSCQPYMPYLR